MKQNKVILIIVTLILMVLKVHSQDTTNIKVLPEKKVNGYIGVGTLNPFFIGLDYHINHKNRIGVKYNFLFIPGAKSISTIQADGVGIKYSLRLNKEIIPNSIFAVNTISAEISTTIHDTFSEKPYYFQLGVGKEKAKSFYWSVGAGLVTIKFSRNWIVPYLKFGFYI